MILGKIVGNVVASQKVKSIVGLKLLLVQPLYSDREAVFVAADMVGAGLGEVVLVTSGEPAQNTLEKKPPIDALIVGIVDDATSL
ncbi:MAG: EutN/CcmL family microcompartment protein [Christensenellales bacterium]|jgi:ethanolamine utilization protein EutN